MDFEFAQRFVWTSRRFKVLIACRTQTHATAKPLEYAERRTESVIQVNLVQRFISPSHTSMVLVAGRISRCVSIPERMRKLFDWTNIEGIVSRARTASTKAHTTCFRTL